jgi:predicted nucleic acid-binding protein
MAVVYPDTNIFIQAVESRLGIAGLARRLLIALQNLRGAAMASELTLAELFAPAKATGALSVIEKMEIYGELLDETFIALVPVSRDILRQTAILRQTYAQKLPNAIHVVTAIQANCRYLMSSDRDASRLPPSITHIVPDEPGIATLMKALRG